MSNIRTALAALAICGAVQTAKAAGPALGAGFYASKSVVASNNGASSCNAVGLAQDAAVVSELAYPGDGKTGLTDYTSPNGSVLLEACRGFAAIPATGLDGFSSTATCSFTTTQSAYAESGVSFAFTAKTIDQNASIGTTTISYPSTAGIGAGCTASLNTTLVRTGR